MNGKQTQTQNSSAKGAQSQRQVPTSQRQTPTRPNVPGEDPGTLTDEDYLQAGGPDAVDAASDPHPDSRPGSRREHGEDLERSG